VFLSCLFSRTYGNLHRIERWDPSPKQLLLGLTSPRLTPVSRRAPDVPDGYPENGRIFLQIHRSMVFFFATSVGMSFIVSKCFKKGLSLVFLLLPITLATMIEKMYSWSNQPRSTLWGLVRPHLAPVSRFPFRFSPGLNLHRAVVCDGIHPELKAGQLPKRHQTPRGPRMANSGEVWFMVDIYGTYIYIYIHR